MSALDEALSPEVLQDRLTLQLIVSPREDEFKAAGWDKVLEITVPDIKTGATVFHEKISLGGLWSVVNRRQLPVAAMIDEAGIHTDFFAHIYKSDDRRIKTDTDWWKALNPDDSTLEDINSETIEIVQQLHKTCYVLQERGLVEVVFIDENFPVNK